MKQSAICEKCGTEEHFEFGMSAEAEKKVRDGGDGRWLCNGCWHALRYTLPPFYVRRIDGYMYEQSMTYTKNEAEEWRLVLDRRLSSRHEVVPADRWFGDRIAHPGYGAKRRAEILGKNF